MIRRRDFLGAGAALAVVRDAVAAPSRIVDTHIHLYDTARPQGVPWPPKNDALLYQPHLIEDLRRATQGLGVTNAIVVEASPWVEDNRWLLDLAGRERMILGIVGSLRAGDPDFAAHLERFAKDDRFRGIRIGQAAIHDGLGSREFVLDIQRLAAAGLCLDALGGWAMLPDLLRLSDRVPALRIVIDHLPFEVSKEGASLTDFRARPQIYAKVSWILRRVDGRVAEDLAPYRDALDEVWAAFGGDRVVYGSNWPVSNKQAPYRAVLRVAREYVSAKGAEAEDRYFWRNSKAAYAWRERR